MIRQKNSMAVSHFVRLALATILVVAVAASFAEAQSSRRAASSEPVSLKDPAAVSAVTPGAAPTHPIQYLRKKYSVTGPVTVVSASPEKIVYQSAPKNTTIMLKGKKVTVQKASLTSASLQDIQPKSKIYIFSKKNEMIIKLATAQESSPTQKSSLSPGASTKRSATELPQH